MGEDTPVSALVLPILVGPILEKLERKDLTAAQTLKSAVSKVESSHPGFLYDLVMGLVKQADLSVNMAESLLKLQGSVPDCEGFFVLLGTKGKKETLEWCMKANLIASRYECPRFKKNMQERKGTVDGYEWRCCNQSKDNRHDVVRSVRKGT
ncbi:uncharacterized protein TNCV_2699411 [Trichonephila clavipes]|nr:uncharacterized protein TNCV_2699411 [Trichonephila clavipes]